MATVVLQTVGQGIGTMLGGPIGGVIGRAVGAVAGNIIDQSLFGTTRRSEGPRLTDLRVMASSEGAPIPRIWGRMRVAGQVIWATHFEEVSQTHTEGASSKGGGGGARITEFSYRANFAVALCEGEIDRIGRVWADGKEFDISGLTVRLYKGTAAQEPDSLIIAKEGALNAPAYRGTAYLVFEGLEVTPFGSRLPQFSFEVFRAAGGAAEHVRGVSIIPGSTEFGYDTTIVTRDRGDGVTESENAHVSDVRSDWTVSLDQLTSSCRNLKAASLVVAWFGTDLRCGYCEIRPGVEATAKETGPETWQVNGIGRGEAHAVSLSNGGPAYGGTPSDASVIRAIADLKQRGLAVMFYPFVLMDVAPGNGKPDPYGGTEQAAYPWRGRITCSIAPGRAGSPDKSAACATQIAAFTGTAQPSDFSPGNLTTNYSGPAGWGYRRMVLHYARLCALAGGVDAFLIGSELRGVTALRGAANSFPFVAALVTLAAEVKAILPGAKVSYAADWSEYFGHQPGDGSGDVFFHLDPLWASPQVDFVGIDNYMPLSDWRDGRQHTDYLAGARSIYDLEYLKSGIAGGEGHDWHYASPAHREAQARSPIADGAYGKPWVFRYKDLRSWWSNAHFNRPGGVESVVPTPWVPQSKPFWFTEIGCAAIDKGLNQPNAFVDAKSSEDLLPHYSMGTRDDFAQNRFVTATGEYWRTAGSRNPVSSVYGGPMLDTGRMFLWAWDARPYPHFPALAAVWADSANYARGHWLNGRIGSVELGALIAAICDDYGFAEYDVSGVEGLVDGFAIDRGMTARDALEGLLSAFGIDAVESGGKIRFAMRSHAPAIAWSEGDLVETDAEAPLFTVKRAQETELPAALQLSYIESGLDYRLAAVEARHAGGSSQRDIRYELPCATTQGLARARAASGLEESWAAREGAEFALPPSALAVEPGDAVTLPRGGKALTIRVDEVTDGTFRKIRGRSYDAAVYDAPPGPDRGVSAEARAVYGKPQVFLMDLPVAENGANPQAPWLAATARPWPGTLAVYRGLSPDSFAFNRLITAQATAGRLVQTLQAGTPHVLDRSSELVVVLANGALSSISVAELLQGGNAAAVGSEAEGWEILQFQAAELIAERTYRLSMLLRGQSGSGPELKASRGPGSRFVLLNAAVVQPRLSSTEAGILNNWKIGPAAYDVARAHASLSHQPQRLGLRPLAPCQLRATRLAGQVSFSWIRRTRIDGDSWDNAEVPLGEESEAYRFEILQGTSVRRSALTAAPAYDYALADIIGDFGSDPGSFNVRIAQMSTVFGKGAYLQRTMNV